MRVYLNHQTKGVKQMTGCYVSNQIADYCNEPDEEYCPDCESPVTE